jgi:hypothetical protein
MQDEMRQPLLEPYMLGDLQLRNRVVMAPLTRTRAENPGHVPTDLMRAPYTWPSASGRVDFGPEALRCCDSFPHTPLASYARRPPGARG